MLFFSNIAVLLWIAFTALVFAGFLLLAVSRFREPSYDLATEPSVLVIMPCRGVDHRFEENLAALKQLDYGNYEVVAVVDDLHDESVKYLEKHAIRIVVSSSSCKECSGKVKALATVFENTTGYDVYAIVDSDAKVGRSWLRKLVSPLMQDGVGVSTTFPYFAPDGGIWSAVKASWGMVGIGMMQSRLTRFVWGGSMAFRSELMDAESLEEFKKMVSDDVSVMRSCKKKGLEIAYVKSAGPTIYSPDDFSTFFEWANRQTALSVSGSREILKFGVIFYSLQIFLIASSVLLSLFVYIPLILFLVPTIITAAKNYASVKGRKGTVFLITFIMPFFYLANLIIASRMKDITWRGKIYKLN